MPKTKSPDIVARNLEIQDQFNKIASEHPDWTVSQICSFIKTEYGHWLSVRSIQNICYSYEPSPTHQPSP